MATRCRRCPLSPRTAGIVRGVAAEDATQAAPRLSCAARRRRVGAAGTVVRARAGRGDTGRRDRRDRLLVPVGEERDEPRRGEVGTFLGEMAAVERPHLHAVDRVGPRSVGIEEPVEVEHGRPRRVPPRDVHLHLVVPGDPRLVDRRPVLVDAHRAAELVVRRGQEHDLGTRRRQRGRSRSGGRARRARGLRWCRT